MKPLLKSSFVILWCWMIGFQNGQAQKGWSFHSGSISFFNANTMLPGAGKYIITSDVLHPGVNLGMAFSFKENNHNLWLTKLRIGYFHHRLSQHALQLFGELAYRYKLFNERLGLEAGLTAGYLHAISDIQVFSQNGNGIYDNSNRLGRPQAMFGLGLAPSYLVYSNSRTQFRLFLEYQFILQAPFVKSYVTVLPYNMLHLGLNVQLRKS